mmetsp:Transcript_67/g.348  ORF Transcript_67/g.348 Transcript_67/m.348 type:complete len:120 (+) Transcript_67:94-453(+)
MSNMRDRAKLGVPVRLLFEGEGHTVTVELKNGEIYRGHLEAAEETMNCQMHDVTMTARDGRTHHLEAVYLRGSQIKFVILPSMLKSAAIFKKVQTAKSKHVETMRGRGRGRGGPKRARQ